jgi:hypothetical protein
MQINMSENETTDKQRTLALTGTSRVVSVSSRVTLPHKCISIPKG